MRAPIAAAAVLALAAACTRATAKSDAGAPADAFVRAQPIAPDAPLDTAQIDLAKTQLDLAAARAAIAEYRQLNDGKNPPSLSGLDLRLSFPGDIAYDPGSGTVKSRTYPAF